MPVYLAETHCHTNLVSPCSRLSPDELVRLYAQAEYSVVIITDHLTARLPVFHGARTWEEKVHRYYSGYRSAREAGNRHGLVVLPGFELTLSSLPGRDFLVYGIDEPLLASLTDLPTKRPTDAFDRIRACGGLIIQAHPFRYLRPVRPKWLDGVEAVNGNPRHNSQNAKATAFAQKHGLIASSGSDTHMVEDVARGGLKLPELPGTIEEFISLVRERHDEIDLIEAEDGTGVLAKIFGGLATKTR
ncbi:MAG: PHP domain-containing protein [Spirochaetota bacterium]